MPPKPEGATVVVRIEVAGRDRLVLARITSRRSDRDQEVIGPLLATADELSATVKEVVARLSREVADDAPAGGSSR